MVRLSHGLSLLLKSSLHGRSIQESLHPSAIIGIILLEIDLFTGKHVRQGGVPGDKGQIGIGALIAHEVVARGQHFVQHLGHAPGFVAVALNGRGQLFRVEVGEPGRLAEVRALAGHLEMEPLLGVVFLPEGIPRVGDGVFAVILLHQVFEDGAGFEEGDVGIGVVDRRDAIVG